MASRRSARVAARASDEEAPADAPASVGHGGIKVEGCGVKEEPASERVGEAGPPPCGLDSVSEGAAEPLAGPQPPASATSAQDTEAAPAVAPLGSEAPPAVRTSARLSSRKRDRLGAAAGDGDAGDGGPSSLAPRKRGRGRSAAVGTPDPAPNNITAVDHPHGASVEAGGGGGGAAGTGAGGAAAEPEGCLDGDAVAVRSSVQSPRGRGGKAAKGGRGGKQGKGGPGGAAATPRRRRLDDVGGSHWRLPTHVLYDVLLFLREAEELVGIGLAFPCAMKTLRTLPDWHAQVRRGMVGR
jgi:hypothetical protein